MTLHEEWLRGQEATLQTKIVQRRAELAQLTLDLAQVQGRIRNPLTWSVDDLYLTIRAHNCLRNVVDEFGERTIRSVGDLVQWSATDLLKVKNLGRSSLADIQKTLADVGLTLADGSE